MWVVGGTLSDHSLPPLTPWVLTLFYHTYDVCGWVVFDTLSDHSLLSNPLHPTLTLFYYTMCVCGW